MRGALIYGKGDVRFDEREAPRITQPTDAIATAEQTVATLQRQIAELLDLSTSLAFDE